MPQRNDAPLIEAFVGAANRSLAWITAPYGHDATFETTRTMRGVVVTLITPHVRLVVDLELGTAFIGLTLQTLTRPPHPGPDADLCSLLSAFPDLEPRAKAVRGDSEESIRDAFDLISEALARIKPVLRGDPTSVKRFVPALRARGTNA